MKLKRERCCRYQWLFVLCICVGILSACGKGSENNPQSPQRVPGGVVPKNSPAPTPNAQPTEMNSGNSYQEPETTYPTYYYDEPDYLDLEPVYEDGGETIYEYEETTQIQVYYY